MDIRPIKSDADYEATLAEIDRLMEAEPDTPEGDRLDVLVTLVEAYEERHYPVEPPDPVDAIAFRMEQAGLTRAELEPFIGARGRVSEVLGRKRRISMSMAWRLHSGLGIPAESLIRPYRLQTAPTRDSGDRARRGR